MMMRTLDLLVSESRVAKVLSFAKHFPEPAPEGNLVSQKSLARVGDFARIFAKPP
jgi:hypothetical protein